MTEMAGQLDIFDALGEPKPDAPVFHVRVGVLREDGTRYLTTDHHCGFCGTGSLSSVGSGSYCGTQDNGDHWMLLHCGRCQDQHIRYRNIVRLIHDGEIRLQITD